MTTTASTTFYYLTADEAVHLANRLTEAVDGLERAEDTADEYGDVPEDQQWRKAHDPIPGHDDYDPAWAPEGE